MAMNLFAGKIESIELVTDMGKRVDIKNLGPIDYERFLSAMALLRRTYYEEKEKKFGKSN